MSLSHTELTSLRIPTSVYGLTKLLDEIIMKKYESFSDLRHVALRYFNVAGADPSGELGEAHPVETHLIPKLIEACNAKSKFALFGSDFLTKDGTAVRDYIHVSDLANGHLCALKYLSQNNRSNTFNLGTGEGNTTLEILKMVEKITNKTILYSFAPRRNGDPAELYANSQKAKNILKWETNYDIYDMIKTAYQWHSRHPKSFGS
ncbi:MAG: NAD-dependent epimerase/dehydratase family protein [bacterium]